MAGRQLPDPRYALQHGRAVEIHAGRGCRQHRRSVPIALRGDRCACTAVRRRHLYPHRLRVAGRGSQPRRGAFLRRRRGLLAQALRHLGPADGHAARPGRLFHHRCQGQRPFHAAGVSGRAGRYAARTG
ncbi:hypothetical protein G6F64_015077 [Rhizopus arrhizus]|uniref:Uncharacterized protein n=1 Tax=Rhizopus oryzae TaxID=64495 RepID=A0A9P7BJ05_RHIOR|nr:hypothetical protein G6F64_015077 [Rhizopus arrhizus]